MQGPTEHLRGLATRVVGVARERVPLRAAIVVGSAARGDADFYSDLDLLLYVDELPATDVLSEIRVAVGGTNPKAKGAPTEHFCGEEFDLDGVRTEVSFMTVARVEWRLDQLLDRLEEIDSPVQKVLAGMLEGLPLHGRDLVERWQARLRDYPEPLRRAMVERHWSFFPVWYYGEALANRDAELWRLDSLLEAAFNLLAVLAGLNRLYFTRAELKRMRALIAKMELAPPRLGDRLESLFRLPPAEAAAELGRLVEETRALVTREFPDLELSLQFPPGRRQKPWRLP
jgi:predicted nucleotidyltransferase